MTGAGLQLHATVIALLDAAARWISRRIRRLDFTVDERLLRCNGQFHQLPANFEKNSTSFPRNFSSRGDEPDWDVVLTPALQKVNENEIGQKSRSGDVLESLLGSAGSGLVMDVGGRSVLSEPAIGDRCSNSVERENYFEQSLGLVVSYSTAATQTDTVVASDGEEECLEKLVVEIEEDEKKRRNGNATGGQSLSFEKRREQRDVVEEVFATRFNNRDDRIGDLAMAAEGLIDDTDLDDECQQELYDVEYEEVTLKRSDGSEKLGLTLCYGKGDDVDTDIFISEIEESSIAFKDGRVRVGDQILQINGVDVHTRNQAMEQFRQDRNDITLLLARSVANAVDYVQEMSADDILLEEQQCDAIREQTPEDDDGHMTDGTKGSMGSAHEKDSGISRATDSDPELPPPINSPSKCSRALKYIDIIDKNFATTAESDSLDPAAAPSTDKSPLLRWFGEIGGGATESEQSSAATPTQANQRSIVDESSDTPKGSLSTCGTFTDNNWPNDLVSASLERELHCLHEEMAHIQLACDRLVEQYARSEKRVRPAQLDESNSAASTIVNSQNQRRKKVDVRTIGNGDGRERKEFSPRRHRTPDTLVDAAVGISRGSTRDETSSAYNTGNESCRSTPLKTIGIAADHSIAQLSASSSMARNGGKRDSAVFTPPPATIDRQLVDASAAPASCSPTSSSPASQLRLRECSERRSCSNVKNACELKELNGLGALAPADQASFHAGLIMYTNPENLESTILLQQRLLREAMIQQAQKLRSQQQIFTQPPFSDPRRTNVAARSPIEQQPTVSTNWTDNDRVRWLVQRQCSTQQFNDGEIVKMEWKIKRRADGTRYLARRPIRNKILKERAEKLSSERCGLSTDDDAWSELKTGRYWTREEKKKHVERARERKRRQEELLRRKAESLRHTSDQPILQLSNKKMLRRQGQQLFDKFTTVQEFLAHGSRSIEGGALGILSVTTV